SRHNSITGRQRRREFAARNGCRGVKSGASGTIGVFGTGVRVLQVALWEPEIPPNTGNIARLCAATETRLHLIGRLGFRLDDRSLRRAGLDYWRHVDLVRHATLEEFQAVAPEHVYCLSAHAAKSYTRAPFRDGDCLLFGGESKGLPPGLLERHAER